MNEELLQEKRALKQKWSNSFISELELLLEKCFLMPKKKKEHFITKERLEVDIIKLLQTQKQFTTLKSVKEDLKTLAVFDKDENFIGRIYSIDVLNETVDYENMFLQRKIKSFDDLVFFNYNSIQTVAYFDKQKMFCDKFNYQDTYRFLMSTDRTNEKTKVKKVECTRYAFESVVPLTIKVNYHKED